ncbi:hypothetical protein LV779_23220 [Streptomyces thinghirensis]|nr:hypothetical protein [Streptomyces thinghirensis]
MPEGGTYRKRVGGCVAAESEKRLYGDPATWFAADKTASGLQAHAMEAVLKDSRFTAAVERWSQCMRRAGHGHPDPARPGRAVRRQSQRLPEAEAFGAEREVAAADATCARETSLRTVAEEREAHHMDRLRGEYGDALDTVRRIQRDALARAERSPAVNPDGRCVREPTRRTHMRRTAAAFAALGLAVLGVSATATTATRDRAVTTSGPARGMEWSGLATERLLRHLPRWHSVLPTRTRGQQQSLPGLRREPGLVGHERPHRRYDTVAFYRLTNYGGGHACPEARRAARTSSATTPSQRLFRGQPDLVSPVGQRLQPIPELSLG